MGQKFFDMHESSRLNMSFNCSGAFNIIYIMRSMMMENGKQPPSVNQSYNHLPFEKPLIRRLLYSRILQYTLAFQRVKINSINVVIIFTLLAI
ncbi:hypothetical protein DJ959_12465 [Salmonella enterica subsp. enterica serovar Typhi]|nr:hypothetical protein [Salmonella enterica subsp. enterica serovar Typhi]